MEGTQLNLQKDILAPQRNYFNAEAQQNIAPTFCICSYLLEVLLFLKLFLVYF